MISQKVKLIVFIWASLTYNVTNLICRFQKVKYTDLCQREDNVNILKFPHVFNLLLRLKVDNSIVTIPNYPTRCWTVLIPQTTYVWLDSKLKAAENGKNLQTSLTWFSKENINSSCVSSQKSFLKVQINVCIKWTPNY